MNPINLYVSFIFSKLNFISKYPFEMVQNVILGFGKVICIGKF